MKKKFFFNNYYFNFKKKLFLNFEISLKKMFELSSNFLFELFEFLEKFEPGSNVFFEPVRKKKFEPGLMSSNDNTI